MKKALLMLGLLGLSACVFAAIPAQANAASSYVACESGRTVTDATEALNRRPHDSMSAPVVQFDQASGHWLVCATITK